MYTCHYYLFAPRKPKALVCVRQISHHFEGFRFLLLSLAMPFISSFMGSFKWHENCLCMSCILHWNCCMSSLLDNLENCKKCSGLSWNDLEFHLKIFWAPCLRNSNISWQVFLTGSFIFCFACNTWKCWYNCAITININTFF